MRCVQPAGTKGSLRWIQTIVASNPQLLTDAVRAASGLSAEWQVQWVSPLQSDQWAEYRDADFLAVTGTGRLHQELADFWPTRGPQWDGLGISSDGGVVLVEAKSYLGELTSICEASEGSLPKIRAALTSAKTHFGVSQDADWLSGYYQYANRLAHLHFLQSHQIPVHRVNPLLS